MYYIYGQKVVTHNGIFHADEVFAIALLCRFDYVSEIIRTRDSSVIEEALNNQNTIVVDCGGQYNPLIMNFDHHQDLMLPASNMLILFALKNHILRGVYADKLAKKLFLAISDYDVNRDNVHTQWAEFNNGKNLMNMNQIIAGFNRNPSDDVLQMEYFEKAIKYAIQIIDNIFYQIEEEIQAESIYDNKKVINDCVAVFSEFCPIWKEKDEFIFVIQPNPQGWALMTKDSSKYPLPDIEHKDLIFAHKGKFIAVFSTKEAAIEVASTL
jgi:uncharacterized UPF0160 family protein